MEAVSDNANASMHCDILHLFLCRLYLPSLRCVLILSVGCNTILVAMIRTGPLVIPVVFTIKIA